MNRQSATAIQRGIAAVDALTWKPGPPKQDDFQPGDWVACCTKTGGRYCCFSARGLWWRENPVTFLPVPLDIELWEETAFHFAIPSPPSGDTE